MPLTKTFDFYTVADMNALPPPEFVISPSIPEGLTLMFGDTNIGKTFLAVAYHCAISAGRSEWYSGHEVRKGERRKTLYVAAEGKVASINQRMHAWASWNGVPMEALDDMVVVGEPVNLMQEREIYDLLEGFKDKYGEYPVLTTFDTLNMSIAAVGDREVSESNNTHMGEAIQNLRSVIGGSATSEPKTSVTLVHHSGHDDKLRYRGASALGAAADSMIGFSYFDPAGANNKQKFTKPDGAGIFEAGHRMPSYLRYMWCAKAKDVTEWESKILSLEQETYVRRGAVDRAGTVSDLVEKSRVLVEKDASALPKDLLDSKLNAGQKRMVQALREAGNTLSVSKLAEDAGLSANTVDNYLRELSKPEAQYVEVDKSTGMVHLLEPTVSEPVPEGAEVEGEDL